MDSYSNLTVILLMTFFYLNCEVKFQKKSNLIVLKEKMCYIKLESVSVKNKNKTLIKRLFRSLLRK